MKTIVLKMVVPDDEEHVANKEIERMLESYGACIYGWNSSESTKAEVKFYNKEQKV